MTQSKRNGRFIVLEGIDGTGTTTQAERLAGWLRDRGRDVLVTCEPSEGTVGKLIRDIIRPAADDLDERVFALLFAADRIDHIEKEIQPAVNAGRDVVSDRYLMSSLAYQSVILDLDWVRSLNRFAPPPDITLLLNAPTELCVERIGAAGRGRERYEKPEYLEQIRLNYLDIASTLTAEGRRIEVLDAAFGIDELHQQIVDLVRPLLPVRQPRMDSHGH